MPKSRAKYAVVALTSGGKETAKRLMALWEDKDLFLYTTPRLQDADSLSLGEHAVDGIAQLFREVDYLICIMATGIAVRAISPVIQDKTFDPAVIVMDEKARHVISLLSGHLGGANEMTLKIATLLGADPVITTATDVQGVTALDTLAKSVNGWSLELRPLVKVFNACLAEKESVYFYQEKEWINDVRGLTVITESELDDYLATDYPLIILTTKVISAHREKLAVIYPKPYVMGVGARKNIASEVFQEGFRLFCQKEGISPCEIGQLVSIDVKKGEKAILDLAHQLGVPFTTYTKEELALVADKYPQSDLVKKTVGVGSVALASADLASHGQVLTERFAKDGCTYALAKLGTY